MMEENIENQEVEIKEEYRVLTVMFEVTKKIFLKFRKESSIKGRLCYCRDYSRTRDRIILWETNDGSCEVFSITFKTGH